MWITPTAQQASSLQSANYLPISEFSTDGLAGTGAEAWIMWKCGCALSGQLGRARRSPAWAWMMVPWLSAMVALPAIAQEIRITQIAVTETPQGFLVKGKVRGSGMNPQGQVVEQDGFSVIAEVKLGAGAVYPELADGMYLCPLPAGAKSAYTKGDGTLTPEQVNGTNVRSVPVSGGHFRTPTVWQAYGGLQTWAANAPASVEMEFEGLIPIEHRGRQYRIRAMLDHRWGGPNAWWPACSLHHDVGPESVLGGGTPRVEEPETAGAEQPPATGQQPAGGTVGPTVIGGTALLPVLSDPYVARAAICEGADALGLPVVRTDFPVGTARIGLYMEWDNAPAGTQVRVEWLRDGAPLHASTFVAEGTRAVMSYLQTGQGSALRAGAYQAVITRDGVGVVTLPFTVFGGQGDGGGAQSGSLPPLLADQYVKRAAIYRELDAQRLPILQSDYPAGVTQIGIYMEWADTPARTQLRIQWRREGIPLYETRMVAEGSRTATNSLRAGEGTTLASGHYQAIVFRDDVVVTTLPFTIGVTQ